VLQGYAPFCKLFVYENWTSTRCLTVPVTDHNRHLLRSGYEARNRDELPVLVLNLNNRYLGMVKQWQDMIYSGRHSQSYMQSLPDFARLAEAYGHVGIRITRPDELEAQLSEALAQVKNGRLVFVDVTVDGSEHVYPMQIRGGGMDEMWLSKTERT